MRIKYIAWKRITCGDAQRILYKIQGGKDNSKDHAIQAFCSKNHDNPGLWTGLTDGVPAPQRSKRGNEAFSIVLENSRNTLDIWQDNNAGRNSPIKIAQRIWNDNNPGDVIETWYVAYMRIIKQLLDKIIEVGRDTEDVHKLQDFIIQRLQVLPEDISGVMPWIKTTQGGFVSLSLDTAAFLNDSVIGDIKSFIDDYYYVVFRYEDELGEKKNATVVANVKAERLHPIIKSFLMSGEKGGDYTDFIISGDSYDVEVSMILNKLYKEKNVILYGAPGTGKTRLMTKIRKAFSNSTSYDCLDTEAPIALNNSDELETSIKWCTFHPDYTYEEFVWGLTPQIIDSKLGYTYHKGPFLEMVLENKAGKKTLLIIDEINRANTDDVFGDTIRLLDKKDRGRVSIPLPEQAKVPGNKMECGEEFYVIGTMNSLDKSVSPLTPELKRIFSIVEMMPDLKALRRALASNEDIPGDFSDLVMDIFQKLNSELRENVGKEYMLGQGYLWDLVENGNEYESTFADILRHKIVPHLKDVYPEEKYVELFTPVNHGVLFRQLDGLCEICNVELLGDGELINAFSQIVGKSYEYVAPVAVEFSNFDSYQEYRMNSLYKRLVKYKNIILAGPSGTGKSSILEYIRDNYNFDASDIMYWHNSTAYDDVIEGISAVVENDGKDIKYSYKDGAIKRLAEYAKGMKSLMGIENIDKSNAGENFGELITLLEPDKRKDISIEGYNGEISLPVDMYFLCTMNPISRAQNKMDSALKRRFIILELYPDYKLLSLWFDVDNKTEEVYQYKADTKSDRLKLSLELLRSLNERISRVISVDAQLGHAVIWGLKDTNECSLADIASVFDETILPIIEDYCVDSDVAFKLLGLNSPLLKKRNFGTELVKFHELDPSEWQFAFKELLDSEN